MSAPQKLTASALAALSDEDLDRFLEANTRQGTGGPDGLGANFVLIEAEDPENLEPSFIERLRDRVEAGQPSKPVNPDQLAARLQAVADGVQGRLSPPSSATPPPTPPESRRRRLVKSEQEAYEALVAEGGVPLYPIRDIERAIDDPYLNLARIWAWQSSFVACDALSEQLGQWRGFRSWQRKQRGSFSLSRCQQSIEKRLKRHGYGHEFCIDEDPENQDRRATWVEFLSYICLQVEYADEKSKPLQTKRRKLWKALLKSGVLRPGETEETLLDKEEISARQREENDALGAWKYPPTRPQASPEAPSQCSVSTAKEAWEEIRRRNKLISIYLGDTREVRRVEYPARKHREQLAWATEQLRVIERELEAAKSTEEPMQDRPPPRRLKRRRDNSTTTMSGNLEPQSDTPQKMSPSKRPRLRALQPLAAQGGSKTTTPRPVKARTRKTKKQAGQLQSPEAMPLRRSSRIAAMRIGKSEA